VDPIKMPAEAVEVSPAHRGLAEEAVVADAWVQFHEEVYAFLVRTVRDVEAAEDLLQEAFLRLTRQVRTAGAPDNTRAWLYRVAANLAVSRGRRISASIRGLLRLNGRRETGTREDTPEVSALRHEASVELVGILRTLPPASRAALLLSSEGFSGAEIAVAIGRSEAATRTLLCRTRLRVRHELEAAEAVR
jgi:RNA polymerase sigma factor (sigma-70 family)